jgi:hypothetical protein
MKIEKMIIDAVSAFANKITTDGHSLAAPGSCAVDINGTLNVFVDKKQVLIYQHHKL